MDQLGHSDEDSNQLLVTESVENTAAATDLYYTLVKEVVVGNENDENLENQVQNALFTLDSNSFSEVFAYEDSSSLDKEVQKRVGRTKRAFHLKTLTDLEKDVWEVEETLKEGCPCVAKNCFLNLDADSVYQHRVNISKLDKDEYNMFLMGIVMTCLMNGNNPGEKLFTKYTFQGRRVCRDAFLYLHSCNLQYFNHVRDHTLVHGVAPMEYFQRLEKNVFSKQMYEIMKEFLRFYVKEAPGHSYESGRVILPLGTTKRSLYEHYKLYMEKVMADKKSMEFASFKNFLSRYFPKIEFQRFAVKRLYPFEAETEEKLRKIVLDAAGNKENMEIGKDFQAASPFEVMPYHNLMIGNENVNILKEEIGRSSKTL